MDAQTLLGFSGTVLSLAGITTSYVISFRKHRRELEIIRQQEAQEVFAREKAERERFYLTTAANLVVSADKLKLSGPQKKDYVMLWLENEASKAGVEVDKALMSVAIERTILILNDYKDKEKPVSELLGEELDASVERERLAISSAAERAETLVNKETVLMNKNAKSTFSSAKKTLSNVQNILK